jgi:hypothetical protein
MPQNRERLVAERARLELDELDEAAPGTSELN